MTFKSIKDINLEILKEAIHYEQILKLKTNLVISEPHKRKTAVISGVISVKW
jgi:hypothetical protein